MALLTGLPSNKFLQRALILFVGITLLINLFFYVREAKILNRSQHTDRNEKWPSQNNESAKKVSIFPSKEPVDNLRTTVRKIVIAFDYWEQLTAATNSFLDLTAFAAYGGRQVVVPFVKNSFFYGSPTKERFKTLALYYNVTALNHTLRSRSHGTLINWKEFQDVCQGKLDVLVHFKYTKYSQGTPPFWPCNHGNTIRDFKVERTICMNVFAVNSVEKFENEVVNKLPCIGLSEWRGSNNKYSYRAQFNLSSVLYRVQSGEGLSGDAASFLSSKLIHVAQDFIAKNLGTPFYSMHIRSEKVLYRMGKIRDVNAVKTCISNLATLVQRHKNVSTARIPIFLAADFTDYGSSSGTVNSARKIAESLMKILAPLKPVIFQPSAYNLTDRGAVAIVEMNILVSGKHLFVVGSGSFQGWLVNQFINKNNIEQKSTSKCQNELCNNLCCF